MFSIHQPVLKMCFLNPLGASVDELGLLVVLLYTCFSDTYSTLSKITKFYKNLFFLLPHCHLGFVDYFGTKYVIIYSNIKSQYKEWKFYLSESSVFT